MIILIHIVSKLVRWINMVNNRDNLIQTGILIHLCDI